MCKGKFGDPEVLGRYLGTNEGVSYGLTEVEIDLLHSNEINILVIWNHFTDGAGYENGQNEATEAVETARELGIPEGALIGGWQYGIDAETCHIDTNIFDGNILKVLW